MKNIIRLAFATMMLAAFASCEDPAPQPGPDGPGTETPELNENIKFTLEVISVEEASAKIKVSHDGTASDSWYAFATENSNINAALSEKIAEITVDGKVQGIKKQTNYTYPVNGLNPETEYTFIVFGITEDGVVYGKYATTKFTTKRGEAAMQKNDAWTVAYNGKATIGNTEYEHTVTVTSTDKNKYFITSYDKATFEQYDIKAIAQDGLAQLKEVVAYYQQQPGYESLTVDDMLFEGDGIDAMNLMPGDWYALAVGVAADGELSGLYSVSEVINIPEEEPTADYLEWIGNWTWTGANGAAFNITFEKGISNMSYIMTGWEGVGLPIEVTWLPSEKEGQKGTWAIFPYSYGQLEFSDGSKGNVYLAGSYNVEDKTYIHVDSSAPICIGGDTADGQKACVGFETEAEGTAIAILEMFFIAEFSNLPSEQQLQYISDPSLRPVFPIVITPAEGAAPASVVEHEIKGVQKFTQAPKPVMTYYQSYVNAILR